MGSWRIDRPKQLRKVVYAMNDKKLKELVEQHEGRGWMAASDFKDYGYGLGCLMVWGEKEAVHKC